MNEANLAIVLGPNLLRPRHESMLRMIEDARHVNGVIQSLLEEYEFLVSVCIFQLCFCFSSNPHHFFSLFPGRSKQTSKRRKSKSRHH
jgi:hypothetical protein